MGGSSSSPTQVYEKAKKNPLSVPLAVTGAMIGGVAGLSAGFNQSPKAPMQEVKNVSGIQDKQNKAERSQQALFDLLNRKDPEIKKPLNQITGQSETLSAAENETQRRRLINQLRGGLASTITSGRNLFGTGTLSTPGATNAKTLLGQ